MMSNDVCVIFHNYIEEITADTYMLIEKQQVQPKEARTRISVALYTIDAGSSLFGGSCRFSRSVYVSAMLPATLLKIN